MPTLKNLEFDETGVANITLETLKQTRSSQMYDGKYHYSCPLESWELVEQIGNIISDKTKANPKLGELFVYNESIDRNFPIPEELRRLPADDPNRISYEKDLELIHFRVDRFIGKMLVDMGNPQMNFAVGFSYTSEPKHLKKLTIGVGSNLNICSNFQIFGNELVTNFKRYEQAGLNFKELVNQISVWLDSYKEKFEFHNTVLQDFRNTPLNNNGLNQVFGEILVNSRVENFSKSIKESVRLSNSFITERNLFTATQVGYLVDESFTSTNFPRRTDNSASVYELLNWGTDILNFRRARHNTIDSLLPCNNKYCSFLLKRFHQN